MSKHQKVLILTYLTEIFTFLHLKNCEKAVSNKIVSSKGLFHLLALKILIHMTNKENLIKVSGP